MSKKLLLADDSITIQKVIQITFAHEDYELTITDNGDAALAKAQELRPDLIMSDVYMPGKNGYELTTAVKQDPALQHIPVLLLAGSFEPFDEDKARSCRADAWIEKPFESQNLIDKVAELLSTASESAPAPVAELEPVVAPAPAVEPEPAAAEAFAIEEEPLAAFDEVAPAEPVVSAASEDPFGDVSFEKEAPSPEPEPATADDWSDVASEANPAPAAVEAFVADEPVAAVEDDFTFAEEEPVPVTEFDEVEELAVADFAEVEELPTVSADFDAFDLDEGEIMPLGDDDILGEEDLEPPMPEQTLAAWSRDDATEDVFVEPVAEVLPVEDEDVFAAAEPIAGSPDVSAPPAVEEVDVFADESVVAAAPVFDAPVVEPAPVEEALEEVIEDAAPVAAAVSAVDVEAKASAMGEDEIEKIIEKVVTKVVEKLAGSILERVAWEVVPDLAENLIREEIRKIKDTAA
ncbi:MAG: response regulator [Deltaproteobacteria bacterium]|nr:MAG: response regulator [Deltaproteobacteria bacterium]